MAKSKTLAALGLTNEAPASVGQVIDLDVSLCDPNPHQPRVDLGDLDELASSLAQAQYHPILVRKMGERYEVADGWRRLTATREILKRATIKALVADQSEEEMLALALVTAIDRKALNPIEEMRAIRDYKQKFGLTYKQIAKRISRTESYVTNRMRADKWPDDLLELVEGGKLDFWLAVELGAVKKPNVRQDLIAVALQDDLTQRALRERVPVVELAAATGAFEPEAQLKVYDKALKGKLTMDKLMELIAKAREPVEPPSEPQEGAEEGAGAQDAPEPRESLYGRIQTLAAMLTGDELLEWVVFGEGLLQKRDGSSMLTALPDKG